MKTIILAVATAASLGISTAMAGDGAAAPFHALGKLSTGDNAPGKLAMLTDAELAAVEGGHGSEWQETIGDACVGCAIIAIITQININEGGDNVTQANFAFIDQDVADELSESLGLTLEDGSMVFVLDGSALEFAAGDFTQFLEQLDPAMEALDAPATAMNLSF